MTSDKFRSLALEIPGAVESSHVGHPDFRIGGKIFASLGYPDNDHGMVKLSPEHQGTFLRTAPRVFSPCAGAWGKQGSTSVHLVAAPIKLVREALHAAAKSVTLNTKQAGPTPRANPRVNR